MVRTVKGQLGGFFDVEWAPAGSRTRLTVAGKYVQEAPQAAA
jgi:hypothetical protein